MLYVRRPPKLVLMTCLAYTCACLLMCMPCWALTYALKLSHCFLQLPTCISHSIAITRAQFQPFTNLQVAQGNGTWHQKLCTHACSYDGFFSLWVYVWLALHSHQMAQPMSMLMQGEAAAANAHDSPLHSSQHSHPWRHWDTPCLDYLPATEHMPSQAKLQCACCACCAACIVNWNACTLRCICLRATTSFTLLLSNACKSWYSTHSVRSA